MPNTTQKPSVASLVWSKNSDLHIAQGKAIHQLGYPHCFFLYDAPIPDEVDIILIQGPYGSLLPFIKKFIDISENERPILIYWFQQSLYIPMSLWMLYFLGFIYSDMFNYFQNNFFTRTLKNISNRIKPHGGARYTFFGDIIWLKMNNLIDILATTSSEYQRLFKKFDIDSLLIPRGYHPDYGKILKLERDIALLWMGKTRTRRRRQIIYRIREELDKQGLCMHIHDGYDKPFIYGEKRTNLLNRTWFVLNIHTSPTDELSTRYYIAAANGAVYLTEPGKNEYPFKNNVHLVECQPEQMVETVSYYINHPDEWQSISQNAFNLISQKVILEKSISTMLTQAEKNINNKCNVNP